MLAFHPAFAAVLGVASLAAVWYASVQMTAATVTNKAAERRNVLSSRR